MSDTTPPAGNPTPGRPETTSLAAPVDLAAALTQMSGLVLSRETVDTALQLVTALAATTAEGTLGAAVTIVDEHGTRSKAASNRAAEQADALQYQFDEGPCLTAWRTQELVRIDDTSTDGRWPRWNEAVSRLGVRSVLSAPLLAAGDSVGAMKVYSERPQNYGSRDEHAMRLLAAQAAILLANSAPSKQVLGTINGIATEVGLVAIIFGIIQVRCIIVFLLGLLLLPLLRLLRCEIVCQLVPILGTVSGRGGI